MTSGARNTLIGPNQLINSIDSFSEAVTSYLSPLVRFVGHKDKYYECLYRKYPDLVQEKRYTGKAAHLVVFDEVPQTHLLEETIVSPDSAYVVCLANSSDNTGSIGQMFRRRVSGTLYEPDIDDLYWHTKALLMIQDISFSNGVNSYPELMSVDAPFRSAISQLVLSVLNYKSCVMCVSSNDVRQSLEDFLFASLPSLLAPFKVSMGDLDKARLPSDRVTYVEFDCNSQEHVEMASSQLNVNASENPVIAIIVIDEEMYRSSSLSLDSVYLANLRVRDVDTQLIAYWCAMSMSSNYGKPRYFSNEQIASALDKASYETSSYIETLLSDFPHLELPDPSLIELVDKYDRPTIDDIFDEAEQKVMEKLQIRANITDAASSAAGIPTVTFRKRMKRLAEKQTFLGLISKTNSDK